MHALAEQFVRSLEDEANDQEHLANEIENAANQYDQFAAFGPYIARQRAKAAETRELIKLMRSDPALE